MRKASGAMASQDITEALRSPASVLSVAPVLVNMLLKVRHNWGAESRQYSGDRGFFVEQFWAKTEAEKLRGHGISFRIDEVPGLRIENSERSLVLVRFDTLNPFEIDESWRSQGAARVGITTSEAIRLLGNINDAVSAEATGVVLLTVPRTTHLPLEEDLSRTWESWPAKPRMKWISREPEFETRGVRDAAALFERQSSEHVLNEARAALEALKTASSGSGPKLKIVT